MAESPSTKRGGGTNFTNNPHSFSELSSMTYKVHNTSLKIFPDEKILSSLGLELGTSYKLFSTLYRELDLKASTSFKTLLLSFLFLLLLFFSICKGMEVKVLCKLG